MNNSLWIGGFDRIILSRTIPYRSCVDNFLNGMQKTYSLVQGNHSTLIIRRGAARYCG